MAVLGAVECSAGAVGSSEFRVSADLGPLKPIPRQARRYLPAKVRAYCQLRVCKTGESAHLTNPKVLSTFSGAGTAHPARRSAVRARGAGREAAVPQADRRLARRL